MIPITTQELERNIREALDAGVPESELEEMREYRAELKSGSRVFADCKSTGAMYRETVQNGKKIIQMSSAPILPVGDNEIDIDDDDTKPVTTFKPSKSSRRSLS